ncbi:MAG TPA: transposase, partial [Sedimentisphaerales bacterium]|nr:transposase [Sedimentisphaerales bacterium]
MQTELKADRADYIKLVVRRLYDAQKLRIQSDLRLQRLVRDEIVLKEDIERTFAKATELEGQIEREYEKIVWREIKDLPIITEWLVKVKGIGPRLGGLLIANILDIGRFANVSKLYAYAGLHVIDGHAVKRAKGATANWNSELKTTCWKIANSFVKQKDSRFREWYEQYKARIISREVAKGNVIWKGDESKREIAFAPKALQADPPKAPKLPEWTLGRIHNMA